MNINSSAVEFLDKLKHFSIKDNLQFFGDALKSFSFVNSVANRIFNFYGGFALSGAICFSIWVIDRQITMRALNEVRESVNKHLETDEKLAEQYKKLLEQIEQSMNLNKILIEQNKTLKNQIKG